MMFGQDRNQIRKFFRDAWNKYRAHAPLEPLEDLIASVILEHPEYHRLLESGDAVLERDYLPETGEINPFLHMGMHIAIREQIAGNRPAAIKTLHRQLVERCGGSHEAEHHMMECLAETLWQAQRAQMPPDERAYLECLRRLTRS